MWDWELEGPIRGLESFGKPESFSGYQTSGIEVASSVEDEDEATFSDSDGRRRGSTTPSATGAQSVDSEILGRRSRGASTISSPSKPGTKEGEFPSPFGRSSRAVFLYGSVGEKIGEACACWLSRWGQEVFEVEDIVTRNQDGRTLPPSDHAGNFFYHKGILPSYSSVMSTPPPLSVWSRGSIPSSWMRAIISSDSFFIRDEWERYTFATRVIDMRRAQRGRGGESLESQDEEDESVESDGEDHSPVGIRSGTSFSSSFYTNSQKKSAGASSRRFNQRSKGKAKARGTRSRSTTFEEDEDDLSDSDSEQEYAQLFREGIYYTYMDFNRLEMISGLGYAPQNVLHSALWRNSALQNSIKASEIAALKAAPQTYIPDQNEPTEAELLASSLCHSLNLSDFVKAQEHSSRSRSPFVGGRSGTPLGNLSAIPTQGVSIPAPDLARRYYPVPVDDTIRLGDGLASLSNSNSRSVEESGGESSARGVAALVDPSTLPLPPPLSRTTHSTPAIGGPLIQTSLKGFFGLDNWVRTGSELAVRGAALADQPIDESIDDTVSSFQDETEVEKQGSDEVEGSEKAEDIEEGEIAEIDENEQPQGQGEEDFEGQEEENAEDEEEQVENVAPQAAISAVPSHLRTNVRASGTPPPGQPAPSSSSKKEDLSNNSSTSPTLVQEHWTGFEPMRASFEFFGVDKLQEKQRLYSPTFHFAGSLWNIYVQTLKKPKGLQLGVYLHRQNPLDSLPPYSIPAPLSETASDPALTVGTPKGLRGLFGNDTAGASKSISSPKSTPSSFSFPSSPAGGSSFINNSNAGPSDSSVGASYSGPGGYRSYSLLAASSSTANQQPHLKPAEMPQMPYSDTRRMLKASFSIHCPSPLGTALTRFSSAPDQFTLSQSWGWKSSSLLGAYYLKDGALGSLKAETSSRFRCCCVIGLV